MTTVTPVLTPRQLQILKLMADGLTIPYIAVELELTDATVRVHQKGLYKRLGVHTGPAAVAAGYAAGLLEEAGPRNLAQPDRAAAGRQIAYRIRAELVCCNVYGRVNDTRELTFKQAKKSQYWHGLCYWGEASARIAETPEQWQDDPTDWDWSGPDRFQRRARRTIENSWEQSMSDRITAPWEEHEVAALNAFQRSGVMHPFTCGGDHELHQTLIAESDGWHCPDEDCDYRQDWAWAFMVDATALAGLAQARVTPSTYAANPLAAELKRKDQLLRETEDQLADTRAQLAAALLRIQALQVHEAIQRIPAQPPDADGLCGEYLYERPIRDVPTGGVL